MDDKVNDKEIREVKPCEKSKDSTEVNPYGVPKSQLQINSDQEIKGIAQPQPTVETVLVWTMLVPAVLANGLFWGGAFGISLVHHEIAQIFGPRAFTVLFYCFPLAGAIYGVIVGRWLDRNANGQSGFAHPTVQFLFQPFWFFVSVTAGCFAIIPFS